jgi:hypothetical protein
MLAFLNILFFVLHTALVVFNMTGWIFKKTRRLHLITALSTLALWAVLGIWYGFGYCPCTDWHWSVRRQMGLPIESDTYSHFLILKLTGLDLPNDVVFWITAIGFGMAVVMSIVLNARDLARKRRIRML